MFTVHTPWVLVFLLVLPYLYYVYRNVLAKKKKQAMKFSHIGFLKSALGNSKRSKRSLHLFWLSLGIIFFMIVGFSNPHIPLERSNEGVNVVLVLDVSGSMRATDYAPTRLDAAKESAQLLVDSLEVNDHVGVVIFESGATTAAYLSPFKDAVGSKLQSIRHKDGRTALGDGLALGVDMASSIPNKKKVVILLSDGVSNAGVISSHEAIEYAKSSKIQVYTIGMGSLDRVEIGKDWFGNPYYAELDEGTLKLIAQETGGEYFKSVDKKTLDDVYKNISEDIEREKEQTNIKDWFFLLALVLFLVQLYMRYGGKRIIQ